MSCHLIILYGKHCVFYRIWFNCTDRIQQTIQYFFVILNLFHASFILMKPTFQICSPSSFLKLWLSLLLNMQNNEKKIWRSRMWSDKEKQKSYSIAKINLVRGHSFMTCAKKFKFRLPTTLPCIHKHPILVKTNSTLGRP